MSAGPFDLPQQPAASSVLICDSTEPLVLRDMERVCALCLQKAQCDRDLAAGTSAEHYEGYRLNASTIDVLSQQVEK
jgi:hypothetical protein